MDRSADPLLLPSAIIDRTRRLRRQRQFSSAAKLLAVLTVAWPMNCPARLERARLRLARGRVSAALSDARFVLDIDPLAGPANLLSLQARRALGEGATTLADDLAQLVAIDPVSEGVVRLARQCAIEPAQSRAGIGFMHLRAGRLLLAERYLDDARELEHWPALGIPVASIQLQTGRAHSVLRTCERLADNYADCLPAMLLAAQAYAELGQLDASAEQLAASVQYDAEYLLARTLFESLPVSRIRLPDAEPLPVPVALVAAVDDILGGNSSAVPAPPQSELHDVTAEEEFVPPSERLLPQPTTNDVGESDESLPRVESNAGELPNLIATENWPQVAIVLQFAGNQLDEELLAQTPPDLLSRLGDELTRAGLTELAELTYSRHRADAAVAPAPADGAPTEENLGE